MYVIEYIGGVARVSRDFKSVAWIATGFFTPNYLALDQKNRIYVTDTVTGTIWRLSK